MRTPWTRLEGTDLWELACQAHDDQTWRRYHGWSHPLHLYGLAEHVFGLAYDPSLDRAILAHDVIQGAPDAVAQSAEWLRRVAPDPRAEALILTTDSHAPAGDHDNRLILLDLADFALPELRRRNTLLLEEEMRLGFGWTREQFVEKTASYLEGLQGRLTAQLHSLDVEERAWFSRISDGILVTLGSIGTVRDEALPRP